MAVGELVTVINELHFIEITGYYNSSSIRFIGLSEKFSQSENFNVLSTRKVMSVSSNEDDDGEKYILIFYKDN